ncbi:glycosyltransferase family 4 protein [Nitrosovibrio tenuis]|uniref:glycosyltransferase family 4 protein n=1 Tax=Nitrosovibrio tenuis TaxID=1233 RepID=UPI001FE21C17|nr:glycosyltransferase family 4 protein [Nitrosovibrio tenuis]
MALLELLEGLIAKGIDCKVLIPKRGPLLEQLDRLNVEWKIIGYSRWIASRRHAWMPGRIQRTVKALLLTIPMARTIKKWQCDVVCSNTVAIGIGALAARLAGCPHVWHLHEFADRDPNLMFDLGIHGTIRLMERLSVAFIANSYAVAIDYAKYISQQKLRMIYQAVTVPSQIEKAERDLDKRVFTCVIVGSINFAKGQDEAVLALAEVVRRGIDAKLLIIGDGNKRFCKALGQQIYNLGLGNRVNFVGYAKNPTRFFQEADVVLVCSRWEAFGRATVEAMLAGMPVIATSNSGGTAELIQDGKIGLLYESGNYDELATKIQYLYENPDERSNLGTAAQIWSAGRFTQERYAKEVFDLFNEVLIMEKSKKGKYYS